MPNRLADSLSPYLRQHAHNPVDWYPWGDEALSRARERGRPILLSIGYSACHWCHVMEHESFDNPEIADLMNELFVSIKVDREERPDLDKVYQTAVQLMTRRSGGWPLTVFLTPDLKPFYGGTYFPPEERHGMPGFPSVLRSVAEGYRTQRAQLDSLADEVTEAIAAVQAPSAEGDVGPDTINDAAKWLSLRFDTRYGGFGDAPKFPNTMSLDVLLRAHARSGDTGLLDRVTLTVGAMIDGGIHDQIGGGFHRYTVDAQWRVPHFEKMLYDNALIARLLVDVWRVTGADRCRDVANDLFSYVSREMTSPEGGFFSSQDADSDGEEGTFFVWTPKQLAEVLGDKDARFAALYYGVDDAGNFDHGTTVLHRTRSLDKLAEASGMDSQGAAERLEQVRAKLFVAREQRTKPFRDEKIIAAWNGLMIGAYAEAGGAFAEPSYVEAAVSALSFVRAKMYDGKQLRRIYKDGRASGSGFLTDYAEIGNAALDVYEATFDGEWLALAVELAEQALETFWDDEAGVFLFAEDGDDLVVPTQDLVDHATPSGTSGIAKLLLRLQALNKIEGMSAPLERTLRSLGATAAQNPFAHGLLLCAIDRWVRGPCQVAIVGLTATERDTLAKVVRERLVLDRALFPTIDGDVTIPGVGDSYSGEGAYVCRDRACSLPTTDPGDLAALLAPSRRRLVETRHRG